MTAPFVRFLLVRHGQVQANVGMRYIGDRDEPLTDEGEHQARALADALAAVPLGSVFSSPLARCRRTAALIATARGIPLEIEPRLREQAFGDWEDLTRKAVEAADPEGLRSWEEDPRTAPPGGESLASVQARVLELAEALTARFTGRSLVLVTHVSPIKALVCAALGVDLGCSRRMFLDPGTISVVDWGAKPVLRLFNGHAHLGWSRARWMGTRFTADAESDT